MNNNEILEARQAAQQLTMLELRKADQVFPRMRRAMEDALFRIHYDIMAEYDRLGDVRSKEQWVKDLTNWFGRLLE